MLDRGAPSTRHTTATGHWCSMAIWAASPAGSGPPFFGCHPQDLVLHGQLPNLALSIPELAILGGSVGSLALQAFLAALQEVLPPGRQPMRFDLEFSGELFKGLPAQQPEHGLHLLARRPSGPGPIVTGRLLLVFVVHRHDRQLHPCLLGVSENPGGGRWSV